MRWGSAYALFACVACSISGPHLRRRAGWRTPPAAATPAPGNQLPPVEVIQKQAQPAPKAAAEEGAAQEEASAAGAASPRRRRLHPSLQLLPAPAASTAGR